MVEIAKAYLMGSKLLVVLYPEKLIGQADFPQFHQLLRKMQSMGDLYAVFLLSSLDHV